MAKKQKSNDVSLECHEKVNIDGEKIGAGCGLRNYRVNKSRDFNQSGSEKLRLKKFCPRCRMVTIHTEVK